MTFQNYQVVNTLYSKGISAIGSSALSIICTSGEEALFANTTNGYPLILEEFNSDDVCIKREIVKFVSRSSNVLTVTRAFESCIQDDSASVKTRTQTALSFNSGFTISLCLTEEIIDDIQNEVERLETDKMNTATIIPAIQNQTYNSVVSTGSSNAYLLAISPAISAYAVGQKFSFQANFTNTGSATANANSLGAITIKKLGGTADLGSGDIQNGQWVELVYNGTNFDMVSPIGQVESSEISQLIKPYVAGEAISIGQPVYISTGAGGRTAGRVYLASSLYTTYSDMGNFIGFATETQASVGGNIKVGVGGINGNQSGLTAYKPYYLTDTAGVIGTTPGTNVVPIGDSESTTTIKIRQVTGKLNTIIFTYDTATPSGVVTYTHGLGKIPKYIEIKTKKTYGTAAVNCDGCWDGGGNKYVFVSNGSGLVGSGSGYSVVLIEGGYTNYTRGVIQNVTETTFDISYTKVGSPTGIIHGLAVSFE